MKTMNKFLSMAALALVGAVMTSCSNEDDLANSQQPEKKSNIVTLTTTVGLDGGTRALTADGKKTFAEGETMAVIYNNGTSIVKAVSHALEAGDITNEGKNATFTFDLETPDKNGPVRYIYPAAMAGDTGVDLTKLNTQEGTFDALQSKYDLCTNSGAWDGENLPSLTLENQLAILAIKLKDGDTDITNTITGLTVSDGLNSYSVTRSAAAGPIYVAIQPTVSADITVTATDGTYNYTKSLTGKSYDEGNGYPVSWSMTKQVCTYTAPTIVSSTLTYNGSGQALVTGGSATGGTIYYRYDYTPYIGSASSSEWSTTVPAPTNAGTYTVYYKVEPNAGYTGGVESTLLGDKIISRANGWVSLSPSNSSGWNGVTAKSAYASITHHGGTLSVTNKSGTYAGMLNAQISGLTLSLSKTMAMGSAGNVTVTVTSTATNNYNAASANYYTYP